MRTTIYAVVGALALAGSFTFGYQLGQDNIQAKWDKVSQEETRQDHSVLLVGMKDSFDTGVKHEETKETVRYVTDTVIKQIPIYIKDSSVCPRLPHGWGLLHQASTAAANAIVASGELDDEGAAALLGLQPR